MTEIERRIADLRAELRSLAGDGSSVVPTDLLRRQDIELTYSSNAIEGNTLTHSEAAELIEHGIVAGGKTLKEHHEVSDHYDALQWVRTRAAERLPVDEDVVLEIHRRTMLRSRPDIVGQYARFRRGIAGSPVVMPNPAKVPALMNGFGTHLANADESPKAAFDAHYRLVTIQPFDDGNGRTARLLTNLMLLKGGYVPVSIGTKERREYLDTLQEAQLAQDDRAPAFQAFMHLRLEAALRDHVAELGHGRQHGAVATPSTEKGDREDKPRRAGPTAAQAASLAKSRGQGF